MQKNENAIEHIPVREPERQYYFIEKCKDYVRKISEELRRPLTAAVITFGCQMNARDSEKLTGILEKIGYTMIDQEEKADFGKLKLDECYLDIGAKDEEQARAMVQIGDTAVYNTPIFTSAEKVVSPYLDNRVSFAIPFYYTHLNIPTTT